MHFRKNSPNLIRQKSINLQIIIIMNHKYLRPTDDFCMLKSLSEAKQMFEADGFYGKVALGLTRLTRTEPLPKMFLGPRPPEQINIIQWICYAGTKGMVGIPAFYHTKSYADYGNIQLLTEIPIGTTFVADEEIFCFEREKNADNSFNPTIFSLAFIDNEEMAMFIARIWGEKPVSATLNKLTIVNNGVLNTELPLCENYVAPIWKVKCENGGFRMLAAFTDDYAIFSEYDTKTFNWQPLSPGKSFMRDNKLYTISDSPDFGYCFKETMSVSFNKKPSP